MFAGFTVRRGLYGAAFAGLLAGVAIKRGFLTGSSRLGTGAAWKMEKKLAPVIALSHGGGRFPCLLFDSALLPFHPASFPIGLLVRGNPLRTSSIARIHGFNL